MSIKKAIQKTTPKFKFINKHFRNRPFKILDIGSGNHSASKTKSLFPNCEYSGVDLEKDFNNDEDDINSMNHFYEMDLTHLEFDVIPNHNYDFIRMAHVIEHLKNGEEVITGLIPKLKPGGYIYLEFPSIRSTKLPSMHGTLNFYDDPTHVRIFSAKEIADLLSDNGFIIHNSGVRRNLTFILAMPFRILYQMFKGQKINGNTFWDVLGFADYVFAQKK